MANYEATARTNYFKVVDEEKFRSYCEQYEFGVITSRNEEGETLYGFEVVKEGGVPTSYFDREKNEDVESDPLTELAEHLHPGHVAIYTEVGHEKTCYLNGFASAINSQGETATIHLDEIMELAAGLGEFITRCER
jgi:hypothetical protein